MSRIDRFRQAQDDSSAGFDRALAEIRSGGKRGHWIWYVFPQLRGLGLSEMSEYYGIDGVAEAEEYLRDPTLRRRLLEITIAVAEQLARDTAITVVTGSRTDATKLVSSMTLFGAVARTLAMREPDPELRALADSADHVLAAAERQGYRRCDVTMAQLRP